MYEGGSDGYWITAGRSHLVPETVEEVASRRPGLTRCPYTDVFPIDPPRREKIVTTISLLLLHVRSPHYTNVYELHGVYSQTLLACTDRL